MPANKTRRSSSVSLLRQPPRDVGGREKFLPQVGRTPRAEALKALIDALQEGQHEWLRELERREASVIEHETALRRKRQLHALAERERRIQRLEGLLEELRARVEERTKRLDERDRACARHEAAMQTASARSSCFPIDFTPGSYPAEAAWWAIQLGKTPTHPPAPAAV